MALLWVLNLSDGRHSLLDVAERAGLPFAAVRAAADALSSTTCSRLHEAVRPGGVGHDRRPRVGTRPRGADAGAAFETGRCSGATAVAVLVFVVLLAVRVLVADQPFAGLNLPLGVAIGALALLAAWTLSSAGWSDASARAMTEYDRTLLYALALVLFGMTPRSPRAARWMVVGLAIAFVGICLAGFITRVLPDVWAAPPERVADRWSYPIGYWNALGMAAALALVFCLHLTCSARESRVVRLVAVMAMPMVASMLLFTFARGPLAVAAIGIVGYLVLARPRLALTGLLAAVPATAVAVAVSYHADFAARSGKGLLYKPLAGADLAEAHDVALAIAGCAVLALLLRALGMLVLDPALERIRLRRRTKRKLRVAGVGAGIAVLVVAVVLSLTSERVKEQYDRLGSDPVTQTGDQRDRLFNPGLNRVERWRVALDAYGGARLTGTGAGTYRMEWERNRPNDENTNEAHSLYLETLSELGLVGAVLLAVALAAIVYGMARRLGGKERSVYGALLAALLAWAIHSGIDWNWELPSLTLWVFAAGGMGLASRPAAEPGGRSGWPVRVVVVLALLVLAITPARLALAYGDLSRSLQAYQDDDCPRAVDAADSSNSILGNLPEPLQVEGYCRARSGDLAGAEAALRAARDRDPDNWRYHYGLAVAQGLSGSDPRAEAARALKLNPREPKARAAAAVFRSASPAARRRAARKLPLDITSGQR